MVKLGARPFRGAIVLHYWKSSLEAARHLLAVVHSSAPYCLPIFVLHRLVD